MLLTAPTGGGKSSLVAELPSDRFEVVVFDSRQVYTHLPIGTSHPSPHEQSSMPHHMINWLSPSLAIDAKTFSNRAKPIVTDILQREKTPILTAGTGFYLKAFLYGMFDSPPVPHELKSEIQKLTEAELREELSRLDPIALPKILPGDLYRLHRALGLARLGYLWSEGNERLEGGYLVENPNLTWKGYFIDWERQELYQRIDLRAKAMIQSGLVEETKQARDLFGEDCPGLNSLGYNFALAFLNGSIDDDSFFNGLAQSHRNYAKKQITWFRRERGFLFSSWKNILSNIIENA